MLTPEGGGPKRKNPAALGARGASETDLACRLISSDDTSTLSNFQARTIALAYGLTIATAAVVRDLSGIGSAS